MRRAMKTLFAAAVMANANIAAIAASPDVGATDVLYTEAGDWQQSSPEKKLALSAAFMRIFCTDARMAPERLVFCLDHDGLHAPVFERAIACSAALSRM